MGKGNRKGGFAALLIDSAVALHQRAIKQQSSPAFSHPAHAAVTVIVTVPVTVPVSAASHMHARVSPLSALLLAMALVGPASLRAHAASTKTKTSTTLKATTTFNTSTTAKATTSVKTTTKATTTVKAKTTTSSAAPAATSFSGNCVVTIPGTGNPLDPTTWTQPWTVTGCDQANGMGTICDITMFDTTTNQLYAYVPLIVDANSNNFVNPVPPSFFVPNANTVMYMGCGTNAVTTTLQDTKNGAGITAGNCTASGLVQYAGCNGVAFYNAVKSAIKAGTYTAPSVSVSPVNHRLCYTDFSCAMTDMDPQDNAPSIYLVSNTGKIAQQTIANMALPEFTAAQGGTTVTIGSDMVVQNIVYDTALQCTDFKIPSAIDGLLMNTMGNTNVFGIANDLTAHSNRTCLPPLNGAFVTATGVYSTADTLSGSMAFTKVNELRALTGVDPYPNVQAAAADAKVYCARFLAYSSDILFNAAFVVNMTAAMPVASNMATFLTQRFVASWAGLNCADPNIGIGLTFPYTNFMSNGIVTGVTFAVTTTASTTNTASPQSIINSAFFQLGQLCGIESSKAIQPGGPKLCSNETLAVLNLQTLIASAIQSQTGIQVTFDEGVKLSVQTTVQAASTATKSTTKTAAVTSVSTGTKTATTTKTATKTSTSASVTKTATKTSTSVSVTKTATKTSTSVASVTKTATRTATTTKTATATKTATTSKSATNTATHSTTRSVTKTATKTSGTTASNAGTNNAVTVAAIANSVAITTITVTVAATYSLVVQYV
ncbi:hypothetical protein HDU82_001680 [Entophlyctis luteolus]|nr:hypothetical protein HDU82_001680 [Entophlyctis luteolus]